MIAVQPIGEEHVTAELGRVIASVLAAAGEGMASLRDGGTVVELSDCSIEVMVDEDSAPSAHVKLRIEALGTTEMPRGIRQDQPAPG